MTGTAVAKSNPIREQLEKMAPSYAKLLPKSYPVDRLITGAMVAVTTNPALAKCTPLSIATSLAKVAQLGLDVGDTAHLVPFGSDATCVVDYKGLVKLMCDAGARKVEAREVREGDTFRYQYGSDPRLEHTPSTKGGGRVTHYYAVVWLRGGVTQFEVMTAEEVDTLRARYSRQWKGENPGPWYGRKTLIRRLAKYVPKTPRLALALDQEDQIDRETGEVLNPVIDIPAEPGDAQEPAA